MISPQSNYKFHLVDLVQKKRNLSVTKIQICEKNIDQQRELTEKSAVHVVRRG